MNKKIFLVLISIVVGMPFSVNAQETKQPNKTVKNKSISKDKKADIKKQQEKLRLEKQRIAKELERKKQEQADLKRTWDNGLVYFKTDGNIESGKIADSADLISNIGNDKTAVVYMHNCIGAGKFAQDTAKFMASLGYVVFVPNSNARENKPKSCDKNRLMGGLHRGVLKWRHDEATNAIKNIRGTMGNTNRKIILQGLAEGGASVATYDGEPVSAKIIEAWSCNASWKEYRGLKANPELPVLSMIGERDPWFDKSFLRGNCGRFMDKDNSLHKSVVFKGSDILAGEHHTLWHPKAKRKIIKFLKYINRTSVQD